MKQAILALIFASPNIRTVEIADRLDIEPDSVRPLIAAEIAKRVIVEEPVIAPNGRTVLSFRCVGAAPVPAAVAATLAPEPIPARIARAARPTGRPAEPAPAPTVAAGDAPATGGVIGAPQQDAQPGPTDAPLEIDVPVTRKAGVPLVAAPAAVELSAPVVTAKKAKAAAVPREKTKVDLGIEYLFAQDGPVPTEFLSRAMGLKKGHHPSSYLLAPIKLGRVVYDTTSKTWCKGVEPVVAAPVPAERAALVIPKFIPGKGVEGAKLDAESKVAADWVAQAEPAEPVIESPAPAPVDAAAAWVASAQPQPSPAAQVAQPVQPESKPPHIGGMPNIRTPFLPKAPELDIRRNGLYENGEFRHPSGEVVGAAAQELTTKVVFGRVQCANAAPFVAGVLSDGSLELRVPGREPFDLPPDHARTLYEFMQAHGYAAWPKRQAA